MISLDTVNYCSAILNDGHGYLELYFRIDHDIATDKIVIYLANARGYDISIDKNNTLKLRIRYSDDFSDDLSELVFQFKNDEISDIQINSDYPPSYPYELGEFSRKDYDNISIEAAHYIYASNVFLGKASTDVMNINEMLGIVNIGDSQYIGYIGTGEDNPPDRVIYHIGD